MVRACTYPGCGRRTAAAAERRCPRHPFPAPRGYQHQQARAQTLAEEHLCITCSKPGTAADPLVAGHVIARAHGGSDTRANMRAQHRSCNTRLGAGIR